MWERIESSRFRRYVLARRAKIVRVINGEPPIELTCGGRPTAELLAGLGSPQGGGLVVDRLHPLFAERN